MSAGPLGHPPCVLFLCLPAYFCFLVTALGVTAGAHRLWSHRSYKAKLPLRIFLAAANSMAFQVSLCCLLRFLDPLSLQTAKERKKKTKPDRNTFICCNMFCWLRGCRAPLTTHITMCTRQTRSNNYIRSKLNVTKSETQHPSNWSVAQGRPHTSQDNMETFIRAKLMQMCLCNQEPVHPGSWRLCAQKGEQASFHNLNLSLFYAVLFTSQMRIRLWRSVLLALCLLVGSPRPQKHLCNTQLVVGVSPEPGSSRCEFGSSSGW